MDDILIAVRAAQKAAVSGESLSTKHIGPLLDYIEDLEMWLCNEGLYRYVIDYPNPEVAE